ncbi:MAG: hypothetical protein NZL83_03485 [Candidatus Absconditabacterales bacterium]|nr:hypothetical protein [Candidatus Absconditabacterales bacterium]
MALWALYQTQSARNGGHYAPDIIQQGYEALGGINAVKALIANKIADQLIEPHFPDEKNLKKNPVLQQELKRHKDALVKKLHNEIMPQVYASGIDISQLLAGILPGQGGQPSGYTQFAQLKAFADYVQKTVEYRNTMLATVSRNLSDEKKAKMHQLLAQFDAQSNVALQNTLHIEQQKTALTQQQEELQSQINQYTTSITEHTRIRNLVLDTAGKNKEGIINFFKRKFSPTNRMIYYLNKYNLENKSGQNFIKSFRSFLFNAVASTREFQDETGSGRSKNIAMIEIGIRKMTQTLFGLRNDTSEQSIAMIQEYISKLTSSLDNTITTSGDPLAVMRAEAIKEYLAKYEAKYYQELKNQIPTGSTVKTVGQQHWTDAQVPSSQPGSASGQSQQPGGRGLSPHTSQGSRAPTS